MAVRRFGRHGKRSPGSRSYLTRPQSRSASRTTTSTSTSPRSCASSAAVGASSSRSRSCNAGSPARRRCQSGAPGTEGVSFDASQANHAGIRVRHGRARPSNTGGRCSCQPSYEAFVYSARDGRKLRKTFPTLAAARAWRADAASALRRGTMRAPTSTTLRQPGSPKPARARSAPGDPYKPSAIRGYEQALRDRILPDLGAAKLSDVARADLQDLADRSLAAGLDPSTIRNALMPLRAIYRRAVARGEVAVNATNGLELPAVRGKRDRIASPAEAESLLAVLPEADRALWATALYAGLRRGELMALRFEDVVLLGLLAGMGLLALLVGIHAKLLHGRDFHRIAPRAREGVWIIALRLVGCALAILFAFLIANYGA